MAAEYIDDEDGEGDDMDYIDINSLPNDQQQYFLQEEFNDPSQLDDNSDDQNYI